MPGVTKAEWPPWQEFTYTKDLATSLSTDPTYAQTKASIIAQFGESNLRKSWLKTCEALKHITADLETRGNEVIPVLHISDVLSDSVPQATKDEIRARGAFVVREVIPRGEVEREFEVLREYVYGEGNRGRVGGWPVGTPSILRLYNSPSQNRLRSHGNQVKLMRWINNLWEWEGKEEGKGELSAEPLVYADAVRIRPPHQPFLGLGPHIDAGSLCRWADPSYRSTYSSIFSGNPENHNSYNLSLRASANQMLFPGNGQSTVLRCFQGWTALSRTAPREGTIRLFPAVKWQIAYILLRPFFRAPEDEADILDAEKWVFDGETPWFPGTVKETSQYVSVASHPHLRLKDCLVYAPPMEAGDTVWWHADMCHAVDAEHTGTTPAAVTYIAATPTTPINKAYMARQHSLMSKGLPPPDFGSGSDESGLVGYEGFKGDEGMWRALMGV
ncbi:hypothetical protein EG328_001101 [Venturia inaequalis]|uniref:DUF1479-domain-containing protein n=1 Tax=Venturia inaequalis TaxID=5025 RepID=A0A8H3V2B3_VENIN|nr:hypothetical protein EG328_001101 [Venturia inaequalis]